MSALYDTDFYAWTQEQAALLRAGKFQDLDLANLIEEVETLGRSERNAVRSHLEILVLHLLKWRYQPLGRTRSWRTSIAEQRACVPEGVEETPSLRPQLPALLTECYPTARRHAAQETRLPPATFPATCPWTLAQVLDEAFWPAEEG